jgi:ribosome-associated toxin RatA of RatAB toxin-antitoxin module
MPSIDIACDDLVVAEPAYVAARLADRGLWRAWWPGLELTPYEERGLEGVRWTVAGELVGTAELWLEPVRDGVVVHWYLRAEPPGRLGVRRLRKLRASYVAGYRKQLWRFKDEMEQGRAPGVARRGWAVADYLGAIVSAGTDDKPEGEPMAEQTTSSIIVDATPAAIMDVIADFEAYPEWADSMRETEVLSYDAAGRPKQVRFKVDAGAISDEYTLDYTWAANEVTWTLVEAKMVKGMDGAYVLAETGDGTTEVTYRLAVDISIPMIGMLKRKAEKVIIDTALKGLKKRVES